MTVPPDADRVREEGFEDWLMETVLADCEHADDIAHEAWCAGWESGGPHFAAAERDRIRQLAADVGATYIPASDDNAWRDAPFADLIGGQP